MYFVKNVHLMYEKEEEEAKAEQERFFSLFFSSFCTQYIFTYNSNGCK